MIQKTKCEIITLVILCSLSSTSVAVSIQSLNFVDDLYNDINHDKSEKPEYFELSYDLDDDSIFYPGQRYGFNLMKDVRGFNNTAKGNFPYWYASYSICMGEHGGTHLDAPFHFYRSGWKLHQIPLNRLVDVPAVVIDVEKKVFSLRYPDEFALEVKHILAHEATYGKIPTGGVVLVRTGWSRYWPDKQQYLGWDNSTGTAEPVLRFPGLSGNAASWLVRERGVVGVGIDTASVDVGNHRGNLWSHIVLCGNQVYSIENVANLDYLLKQTRTRTRNCNLRLFVLPIKTKGTGGPARIVAYCKNEYKL